MARPLDVVTTVITPAATHDLTDLATAKDELKIPATDKTADTFLARAITQSSSVIASFCNRIFPVEAVQDILYLQRGVSSARRGEDGELQLSRWPITAVTSVVETDASGNDTTLAAGTDYMAIADTGRLLRLDASSGLPRRWRASSVTVNYSAGFNPIPADVVDATLRLVAARMNQRGRDPMIRSEGDTSGGNTQYWVGAMPGQNGSVSPEIAGLLQNYRQPVAG